MKRILVLGGGLIGARHAASVRAHDRCTLAGVVDPNPAVAADYRDMSEVTDTVDGVIIATPTGLHAGHGIEAARRGWHMLIEKPVAADLAQADALADAAAAAGVASLVGHHRRYHAHVRHLKKMIADGAIGRVVTASLIWAMRKPDAYFAGNWRSADGSPVMINLVHDIDILRFVLGGIAEVAALRGAAIRGGQRIESGAAALLLDSGATATISFADNAPSPWGFEAATGENPNIGRTGQDMMWIAGTEGAIAFPSMTLWSGSSDWQHPAQPSPIAYPRDERMPLDLQLDHFIDVMSGTAEPLISAADARQTLDIALRLQAQLAGQRQP